MKDNSKISRKQFLAILGTAAASFAVARVAGMVGSTAKANIADISNQDKNGYGNFPYGGIQA